MNKKEYLTNFKVMFSMLVGLVLLILLFLSSNIVHAMTVSSWVDSYDNGPRNETPTMESITFSKTYEYSDYNSDSIKELVFELSNNQFFDGQSTIEDFYSNFTYVVRSYNASTIRVYVQDYNVMLNYQGLNSIEGSETKFFFYNSAYFYKYSSYLYYGNNFGVYYNWYIDINYNSLSYTFSSNSNRLIPEFETLCKKTGTDYISRTNTAPLFDSYNGNFAWIEQWSTSAMPTPFQLSGESYPSIASIGPYYYYNIFDIPDLEFVSSGVPLPEEPGDDSSPDYTDIFEQFLEKFESIDNNTNESKGFLEGIGETLDKIGQSIGEGLNDLISALNDTLEDFMNFFIEDISKVINAIEDILDFLEDVFQNILQLILQVLRDIYSFISGDYDLSGLESFFDSFTEKDYGLSIFITGPLDILSDLDSNSCRPIKIPLPLLNDNNSFYLPCMTEFYQEQIPDFLSWWQILSNALVIFFVGRGTYNAIHDLLDPKARDSAMRGLL